MGENWGHIIQPDPIVRKLELPEGTRYECGLISDRNWQMAVVVPRHQPYALDHWRLVTPVTTTTAAHLDYSIELTGVQMGDPGVRLMFPENVTTGSADLSGEWDFGELADEISQASTGGFLRREVGSTDLKNITEYLLRFVTGANGRPYYVVTANHFNEHNYGCVLTFEEMNRIGNVLGPDYKKFMGRSLPDLAELRLVFSTGEEI